MAKRFWTMMFAIVSFVAVTRISIATEQPVHRIVYINSYDRGYSWSDDIEQGLRDEFASSGKNIEISTEYLDSRRFAYGSQIEPLAQSMAAKYVNYRPDLVVVSDNAAFDFAVKYREKLFPGLPIVFCGYNNFRPEVTKEIRNITGVNEEIAVEDAVRMALKVHPQTGTLAFLVSTREFSSKRNYETIKYSVLPKLREQYEVVVIEDASADELRQRLGQLPGNTLLLLLTGQVYDPVAEESLPLREASKIITNASPFPAYTFWNFHLNQGVIGGHIVNGKAQGQTAAELSLRILGGTPVDEIPVVMKAHSTDIFDYNVMKRFAISPDDLPDNAQIINKPYSLWDTYRWQILGILVLLGVETVLITLLLNSARGRRNALNALSKEQALLEDKVQERTADLASSEEKLRTILDSVNAHIYLKDTEGRYVFANRSVRELWRVNMDDIIGFQDDKFFDAETTGNIRRTDHQVLVDGKTSRVEEAITVLTTGKTATFLTVKLPLRRGDGSIYALCGISTDITERKQAETALRGSEELLREAQALAHMGNWSLDLRSGKAVWSDEEYRLLGYEPGSIEPTSENFLKAIHPQDVDSVTAEIQRAINPNETRPYYIVHRVVDVTGERIVEQRGKVIFDENERPVRMHGTTFDVTERKRVEKQIEHLAYHDQLTDLPNRSLFLDRLGQALTGARRHKRFGAVMFVDLDQFKNINDVHGHTIGDNVLKEVALRLRFYLREADTVARFGGDEFVILLPELSTDQETAATLALSVAEKVRAALEDPARIDGQDYQTTASIGVSLFPTHGESVDDLIREADIAMYRAKDAGRNALVFFEQDMQAHIAERYILERDLRDAVKQGALELFVQSQVNAGGDIIGAETLVRWQHPNRGLISPASFIPLAEETGLIVGIGEWVLREACRLLAQLDESGHSMRLAVNVSPRQFHQTNFVTRFKEILAESGADPLYLTLEITENLLVERTTEVVSRILELSELGIRFSIDDFGTGYSSLAYIKRLPLNELKIDKSFVQDVPNDPNDVALVETILSMAHHLHLEVVAEGVESQTQLEFLTAQGCGHFQGYFFHRPQPSGDWLAHLSQS